MGRLAGSLRQGTLYLPLSKESMKYMQWGGQWVAGAPFPSFHCAYSLKLGWDALLSLQVCLKHGTTPYLLWDRA